MQQGKRTNIEERVAKTKANEAQAKEDRILGVKFEALKVLTGYFAGTGKVYDGQEIAAEVEAFLKGINYG